MRGPRDGQAAKRGRADGTRLPNLRSPCRKDAFAQGLRELGYEEGHTIVSEWRGGAGTPARARALAIELVQLPVDVLVAGGAEGPLAAMQATRTRPMVVQGVVDPVAMGRVTSLARPGGNMTGTTSYGLEADAKRLELLKEAAPHIARVAILVNAANPAVARRDADLEATAAALGVQLSLVKAGAPSEFERAFAAMVEGRADALFVVDSAIFHAHRDRLGELVVTYRLPAVSRIPRFAAAGGLMQYGESPLAMVRQAATQVGKILKGSKPAELPVERPLKFELVLNLKTAKALGITVPPSLLLLADGVIQ